VTDEEIQTFLDEVNDAYPAAELMRQDVCFTYGGLLPKANEGQEGVQLVKHYHIRDHKRDHGIDGLISVVGVKFTEARHVAEKTVDLLLTKLGLPRRQSKTATTPLYGGDIEQFSNFLAEEVKNKPPYVSADTFQNMLHLYGSAYPEVLKCADSDVHATSCASTTDHLGSYSKSQSSQCCPGMVSASQSGNSSLMRAEVLHSIRNEMAQKLADVVFRRTSLGLPGNHGSDPVHMAAAVMANELKWNLVRTQEEINAVNAALSART
jgi:glycerol-3-phosphate dehydrogenase